MKEEKKVFSRYQAFIIAILAILQFTVVLDFMVLSPLGPFLMREIGMQPSRFGLVVSAYAFSAGASGLLTAGFADKYDRKKLLLFFYTGFIIGTLLCALSNSFGFLLFARIFTGLFGGVISSITFAIVTDIFALGVRGRVMGFVQMAFSSSQVLGIPVGLFLANSLGWHSPFFMIVGISLIVGFLIWKYMQPITAHVAKTAGQNAFRHLGKTLSKKIYLQAFATTVFLATGGFMMMPFSSAFNLYNLGITEHQLPWLFMATGFATLFMSPLIGKLSDKLGKYKVFLFGTAIAMVLVVICTHRGLTSLSLAILLNVVLFIGLNARMISASALMTAVPQPQDRGAFMGINSSIQQMSGGIGSAVAGMIIVQQGTGPLMHYDVLGYTVVGFMILCAVLMLPIKRYVQGQKPAQTAAPVSEPALEL